jgi:acyl-CoA thioester hydrolase
MENTRPQARPQAEVRGAFWHFETITTRWMDNDVYGHVNNVMYYSYFDTAVNRFLIKARVLDPQSGAVIGVVANTQCHYFGSITFPQTVHVGLKVAHMGRSSVRYALAIFADNQALCAASGEFTHVYVNRDTRRPVPVPHDLVAALKPLTHPPS